MEPLTKIIRELRKKMKFYVKIFFIGQYLCTETKILKKKLNSEHVIFLLFYFLFLETKGNSR